MICLLTSVHELGFETNLGKKMPLSNSPSKVSGPANLLLLDEHSDTPKFIIYQQCE